MRYLGDGKPTTHTDEPDLHKVGHRNNMLYTSS